MIRKEPGYTLIEFTIFIVVIGVLASVGLLGLQTSLRNIPDIQNATTSLSLAQQRMEFIIGQRDIFGYAAFDDPCRSVTPPAICIDPSGFVTTSLITITNPDTKTITVNVTGPHSTTLEELVLNDP